MKKETVILNVNGESYEVHPASTDSLADVLRNELGLMGTRIMCNDGACGACTVIMDGEATLSCMMPAMDAEGKEIITIEGLPDPKTGELHPIQQAYVDHNAMQCGFCTPGFIMSSKALLDKNPHPSEEEIRQALSGNICRCGTYRKITEAVLDAADRIQKIKDGVTEKPKEEQEEVIEVSSTSFLGGRS